jgi:atypical dual specificity phosphatase
MGMIWVIENVLAHSEYPHREDLDILYKKGIRAIVSLEDRPDTHIVIEKGFEYLEEYIEDYIGTPTIDQLTKINEFIDLMIIEKKPVLVHCFVGGRSGTVLAAYLIYKGKRFNDALSEVREKVPCAADIPIYEKALKEYEKWLKEARIKDKKIFENKDFFGSTWYLQTKEIDDMYKKAVRKIEKQIITQRNRFWRAILGSEVSLGTIITHLIPGLSFHVGLARESAESDKVIRMLSPYEKFRIAVAAPEKEGLLCDLNESLREDKKVAPFVYFRGKANFTLCEKNPELVLVKGIVEEFEFRCYCSKEYFIQITSSLFETLLSARDLLKKEYLDVFCIGTLIDQSADKERWLLLKLFYIGGRVKDIHSIYKIRG